MTNPPFLQQFKELEKSDPKLCDLVLETVTSHIKEERTPLTDSAQREEIDQLVNESLNDN